MIKSKRGRVVSNMRSVIKQLTTTALVPMCIATVAACDVEPTPREVADGRDATEGDSEGGDDPFRVFESGARYVVRNRSTGQCIDIPWGSPSALAVNQYPCHGGGAQQFDFESIGSGQHRLRNASSGRCPSYSTYVGGSGCWSVAQGACTTFGPAFDVQTVSNTSAGAIVRLESTNLDWQGQDWCLQTPPSGSGLRYHVCDGGLDQQWELVDISTNTCEGSCGGRSEGSCWCDSLCTGFGDCCFDFQNFCGGSGSGGGGGGGNGCSSGETCCEPLPGNDCNICVPDGNECP